MQYKILCYQILDIIDYDYHLYNYNIFSDDHETKAIANHYVIIYSVHYFSNPYSITKK